MAAGAESIRTALAASAAKGEWLTVVDAIEDRDLLALGAALDGARLLTGGSGIALGLAGNFAKAGRLAKQGSAFKPRSGPAAAFLNWLSSWGMTPSHLPPCFQTLPRRFM